MLVIPSIDLMDGRCVQLVGGDPRTRNDYGDPLKWVRKWEKEGANLLHVVDLDAALGIGNNLEVIKRIVKEAHVPVQVGGGIRSEERARELIESNVERIVVGTAAVKNPPFVEKLIKLFGKGRVAIALDSRQGRVLVNGWRKKTKLEPQQMAQRFEKIGVWGFLFTAVDREGRMKGPDISAIRKLVEAVRSPVIASGGVGCLDDLLKVKQTGAYGAVVGMALYEKKFTLKQALEVVHR